MPVSEFHVLWSSVCTRKTSIHHLWFSMDFSMTLMSRMSIWLLWSTMSRKCINTDIKVTMESQVLLTPSRDEPHTNVAHSPFSNVIHSQTLNRKINDPHRSIELLESLSVANYRVWRCGSHIFIGQNSKPVNIQVSPMAFFYKWELTRCRTGSQCALSWMTGLRYMPWCMASNIWANHVACELLTPRICDKFYSQSRGVLPYPLPACSDWPMLWQSHLHGRRKMVTSTSPGWHFLYPFNFWCVQMATCGPGAE